MRYQTGLTLREPPGPYINFSDIRRKVPDESPVTLVSVSGETNIQQLVPPSVDYQSALSDWKMLGNDRKGNCVPVAWANSRRLVTSKLGPREIYPSQSQVDAFDKMRGPTYNDEPRDFWTACDILDANPLDGVKPVFWSKVSFSRTNRDELRAAIAIFGFVFLAIRPVSENEGQFDRHQPWTVSANSKPYGGPATGHGVMAAGYDRNNDTISFVTWGGLATLSKQFLDGIEGTAWENMVTEAYVVVYPEHIGTRRFLAGIDLEQLGKAIAAIRIGHNDYAFPALPLNSLWLVQYTGTASNKLELHNASAQTSFTTNTSNASLPLDAGDSSNGFCCFESNDLYFIKGRATGSGKIEVHRMVRNYPQLPGYKAYS